MKNVGKLWLIMLLMLVSTLFYAFKTPNVEAGGTIYIRVDGSIDPPTANIAKDEFNVTYTFTGNNYDTIVIERNNIILNGAGFILQVASADGIRLSNRSNVTIKNLNIDAGASSYGIYLSYSSNITISNCTVYLSSTGISVDHSSYNEIHGNRIERNGIGIDVTGLNYAHHNLIHNNTVASNRNDGITLGDSRNSVYWNNITDNAKGISVIGNFHNVYENNVTRNKRANGIGVSVASAGGGCNVSYNYVAENEIGFFLQPASQQDFAPNTLKGNVIANNSLLNFGILNYGWAGNTAAELYNDVDVSNTVNGKPIYYWINRENDTVPSDAGFVAIINCKNITVENLNLERNLEGVLLAFSNDCTISENNVTNNGEQLIWGGGGIVLYHSSNNLIRKNNVVTDHWTGDGIRLETSSNNMVSENNITETHVGVYMYYSDFNNVSNNFLRKNGKRGISLEYSSNNTVYGNEVLGSGEYGVYLGAQYNDILENNITAYKYGLYVTGSRNTIAENNIMENWEKGIFAGGSKNTFFENSIINNNNGVYLYGQNNLFFHNNFADNTKHVSYQSISIGNSWNSSFHSGGNYWSGYEEKYPNATELDGSGLWNTQYVINSKNIDYFPLMVPTKPITRRFTAYSNINVEVSSNSSISQFQFNINAKSISFNITGPAGTRGFCDITVPLNLLWGDFTLHMDRIQLIEGVNYTKTCNEAQCIFHVTYAHSTHEIEIFGTEVIPELSGLAAMLFAITAVLATLATTKTRKGINRIKGFHSPFQV
ncbi:MAG: NosD domain-containing protein [Candidatus Bathyarchaeia archaeon]